ncbi:hypothetical protein BDV41DRAFT_533697 [Aspergillus transmontanensis]|uniref:Uncharacterized protein n=1 Tax=Aspergillus transmontanensis TaxID=1034304 RepID=A0A5N6W0Y0_9EURO|nr:hypothetical protein BDV41DRAFT_533697 [Aspergillus transmontanensis]
MCLTYMNPKWAHPKPFYLLFYLSILRTMASKSTDLPSYSQIDCVGAGLSAMPNYMSYPGLKATTSGESFSHFVRLEHQG